MGSNWKGTAQFQRIHGVFANYSEHEFARRCMPLLNLLDPNMQMESKQSGRDTSGIDACSKNSQKGIVWAIQFKGFEVDDSEMGTAQINQCLHSIDKLRKSRHRPIRFTIIHNRNHRQPLFREKVGAELRRLVDDGIVQEAELWQLDDLLLRAFDLLDYELREEIKTANKEYLDLLDDMDGADSIGLDALHVVPYSASELEVTQLSFNEVTGANSNLGDPIASIGAGVSSNLVIIKGGFGLGKTTLAKRLAEGSNLPVIFAPAALLPSKASGSKEIQRAMLPIDRLLERLDARHQDLFEKMLGPIAAKILEQNDSPLAVIVDGLDESQLVANPRGFHLLFATLVNVRSLIVLTMRDEFWTERKEEIQAGLGPASARLSHGGRKSPDVISRVGKHGFKIRRGQVLQLEPWGKSQISELIGRFMNSGCLDSSEINRLSQLRELVDLEKYHELYGDIPCRPLFLRMLIDHVRIKGIAKTGLVRLFESWIGGKVHRDCHNPRLWNEENVRVGISGGRETIDETIRIAWKCMMEAAGIMWVVANGKTVLKPTVSRSDILNATASFCGPINSLGLTLNTLLVPIPSRFAGDEPRFRFAHAAFQEFLFARWLRVRGTDSCGDLPLSVSNWIALLEQSD